MASNAKKARTAKAEPTESKAARRTKLAMHPGEKAALVIAEFGGHFGDLDVAAHPQQTHLEAVPALQGTRHPYGLQDVLPTLSPSCSPGFSA